MEYLHGLNERQKEAVLTTQGPISVLAGAGSGKTRVLTSRIYHLIREGTPPEKILAVTFTNKAAREMRERLATLLGETGDTRRRRDLPFIATFHGLGREILETHGRFIGVPRYFSIFDRDDSERAIKEALKALDVDPKEVPPRTVLGRISKAKGAGMRSDEFHARHARESFRTRIVAEAWLKYERSLKEAKALDFDDLILLPLRLLEEHPEALDAMQSRFSHVHIDEYQDTNELQGRLANLLSGKHRNLFVVGDIDQTIYTWRGATIENLLEFDRTYPDAKTVILEENYRSTGTIVAAANQVIEKNRNRKEKRSVTTNDDGEPIHIHLAANAEGEAAWIASDTKKRVLRGDEPESIAVLYRTNFQSRALEEAFLRYGVPYRLLGIRFFDRKEIKDAVAWMRAALDPTRESDRLRAMQAPARGIGKTTVGKIMAGKTAELRAADRTKIAAFDALIETLHRASKELAPSAFVKLVIEKSGLMSSLEKGGEEGEERIENAKELATFASRFDATPGEEGICAFLADAALSGDQDEIDRPREEVKKNGVTLMTVHAAKGLEFDTVYVSGLEQGLFPHEGGDDNDRDEEEERRLFYVAMTRARKTLILTLAHVRRIYGTDFLSEPSQFLSEIDPSLTVAEIGEHDGLPQIH
ncbi:MAG: UvrD-helicase domain-containing protein [Candidatus Pacebacteria bacterium]|nr:UvrD-helicase domain-containing protein [Candidatus Paceibacterota bacterium]MBP9840105.1 UvrD-helicase domain-containing protein [Candidatus Paceibacterota bacterium]